MIFEIAIENESAWAPGVETSDDWRRWAAGEREIGSEGRPELKVVPAMLRRRLDRLGRMALHTAYEALGDAAGVPLVFASRTGETHRSVELLRTLAAREPLSPTEFGLSVHNACGGVFTIARRDAANCVAVSAGIETLTAALTESALLLQEHERVLLVYYEEQLPQIFEAFADERQHPYAFSLLLSRSTAGKVSLRLSQTGETLAAGARPDALPWGVQFLKLLHGDETRIRLRHEHRSWTLERYGSLA